MKKYSCVLFDLDGTIANTFLGIFHSYQYAAEKMELLQPNEETVAGLVGAPLDKIYKERFNLSEDKAVLAMDYYRQYYASKGVLEIEPYDGMKETLLKLKRNGISLGVTTLKKELFAKEILNVLGILQYFNVVIGMDEKDILTKSEMIRRALDFLNQPSETALLVGDSIYDALGAKESGIDFLAVTYGFGFKEKAELVSFDTIAVIEQPKELLDYLI
ncbi:MAG: HAD hydrolase-like protein [Lachnospiraceae bacterium]|nr:HAD hydrolase-like protein [Lachnospiraceae bacterium]